MGWLDFDWKWIVGSILVIAAFVGAGLYIGTHGEETKANVQQNADEIDVNREALVTVCSSLTVLGIVFEQLAILDRAIATDQSLALNVRARVRQRAALYNTAVEALNETNPECEQIE
jgi:hypothetical protein